MFVGNDYEWLKTAAIVMAAGICGMGLYIIMKRKLDCSRPENFVSIASWFIWTCVLFLPAMHESMHIRWKYFWLYLLASIKTI